MQIVINKDGLDSVFIKQGANVTARCRWTDMTPLHYAAFFNCANVINVLAKTLTTSGESKHLLCKSLHNTITAIAVIKYKQSS